LKERGFYINYLEDLPGPIVYDEQELFLLLNDIKNIQSVYQDKLKKFNEKYNYLNDGYVCERTIQKLKEGFFNNGNG